MRGTGDGGGWDEEMFRVLSARRPEVVHWLLATFGVHGPGVGQDGCGARQSEIPLVRMPGGESAKDHSPLVQSLPVYSRRRDSAVDPSLADESVSSCGSHRVITHICRRAPPYKTTSCFCRHHWNIECSRNSLHEHIDTSNVGALNPPEHSVTSDGLSGLFFILTRRTERTCSGWSSQGQECLLVEMPRLCLCSLRSPFLP